MASARGTRIAIGLVLFAGLTGLVAPPVSADGAWLDQPLANWNRPGAAIPKAPAPQGEPPDTPRCAQLVRRPTTVMDRALVAAGWRLFGPMQIYGGTAVVTAGSSVDGMCRPLGFQAFVFVDGKLAGTLSPVPMDARTDGAETTARLVSESELFAEFARYAEADPLCCPSRLTTVTYRIERQGKGTVVVPVGAATAPSTR